MKLVTLVILIPALAACRVSTTAEDPQPAAIDVAAARAETVDLAAAFEAGGVVRARTTAAIASRVLAPITQVNVHAGERVRRGQVLVTLDNREVAANQRSASAGLQSAAGAVRVAESDAKIAEAHLRLARATFDRISALHQKRSATDQELDQASSALSAAESALAAAQARAAVNMSTRDSATAFADASRVSTSYAVLTAPFDGVIVERLADPGSIAVPGAPLLKLEDTSRFRLETQVDEARLASAQLGNRVPVRFDNIADRWMDATVGEVSRIDGLSHTFLVKIDLPADPLMRSGIYGRARFPGPSRRTLVVPASAVVRRGQLAFVFTIDGGGIARMRAVTTGDVSNDVVEILAGLENGAAIVRQPPADLRDGARVRTAIQQRGAVR